MAFSRRGYTSLLSMANDSYRRFLSATMAGKVVLYLGFSFTDGYVNELRRATMAMLADLGDEHSKPIAYAVLHNTKEAERDFYRRYEGVQVLPSRRGSPPPPFPLAPSPPHLPLPPPPSSHAPPR